MIDDKKKMPILCKNNIIQKRLVLLSASLKSCENLILRRNNLRKNSSNFIRYKFKGLGKNNQTENNTQEKINKVKTKVFSFSFLLYF